MLAYSDFKIVFSLAIIGGVAAITIELKYASTFFHVNTQPQYVGDKNSLETSPTFFVRSLFHVRKLLIFTKPGGLTYYI